jgi:hypothetical protein
MKTQAWGWLAAGVLAAGLNASYHDGGLAWAHQLAGRVEHSSAAVLALASGHTDQFLAEARVLAAGSETGSCRWATAVSRAQARIARSDNELARVEAFSDREQAQLGRLEASRARIGARVAARTARIRIPAIAFSPVSFSSVNVPPACPRWRASIPRMPQVRVSAPEIDFEMSGAGPI